jgi:hypothetical protein
MIGVIDPNASQLTTNARALDAAARTMYAANTKLAVAP